MLTRLTVQILADQFQISKLTHHKCARAVQFGSWDAGIWRCVGCVVRCVVPQLAPCAHSPPVTLTLSEPPLSLPTPAAGRKSRMPPKKAADAGDARQARGEPSTIEGILASLGPKNRARMDEYLRLMRRTAVETAQQAVSASAPGDGTKGGAGGRITGQKNWTDVYVPALCGGSMFECVRERVYCTQSLLNLQHCSPS